MLEIQDKVIELKQKAEWGTFKDSLKAPVHRWFTYPAGFSHKAVESTLNTLGLIKGESVIYDPFMGSGTTNIVAKQMGFNSIGVEAHPFVYPITKTKMNWDIDDEILYLHLSAMEETIKDASFNDGDLNAFLNSVFPELIIKCYLPDTLYKLYLIREYVKNSVNESPEKQLMLTALISVLRQVSIAATGWPYIAPNKIKVTSISKLAFETYRDTLIRMIKDIYLIKLSSDKTKTTHHVLFGDSRKTQKTIKSKSVDHIFTSPPYLNNFDYADRTRLEMYFMGDAINWGELSKKVRSKLITSATTQVNRTDAKYRFSESFIKTCPDVYKTLQISVSQLESLRHQKKGKKSYDLMVVGYFNDLFEIIKESYRVLKPNTSAKYILGDSAPYGVHIATDVLIGEIGKCVGFSDFKIEILRTRGDKWADNPQRHKTPLRETIVTLYKSK